MFLIDQFRHKLMDISCVGDDDGNRKQTDLQKEEVLCPGCNRHVYDG